jgi:fermentation-respiration switch protein FrsA (DUF1100 family)
MLQDISAIWRQPKYSGPERRKAPRWRPRPVRVLLFSIAFIALVYVAAALWLISQEARLVFRAGATLSAGRPSFLYEQVDLPRSDGARQFAWAMPARSTGSGHPSSGSGHAAAHEDVPWVLYLHGNAATIASQVNISHYEQLTALGTNVLAPEYRGFGGLDGVPSEASLGVDARAAYEYLRTARGVPPERIVIYGWSLGGAVAVALAADTEQAAMILEGAPASLLAIGQLRYPLFPIALLMRNPFEAITRIDRVRSPILFLHSTDDEVIPLSEGRRLFDAARAPKTFVEVRGGHVYASEIDAARFYGAIEPFLVQHGVLQPAEVNGGSR